MLLRKVLIGGLTGLLVAIVLFFAYRAMFAGFDLSTVAGAGALGGAVSGLIEEVLERILKL